MSTKIYNGFRINSLSAVMQAEFIRDLKERLQTRYADEYFKVFAEKSLEFIDRLSVMDQEGDFESLKKSLMTYHYHQMPVGKMVNDSRYGMFKETDEKRMHDDFAKYFTVKSLFLDILEQDIKESEMNLTVMNSDTYFKTSLVMFPINKSKTLLMTYPDTFTNILSELASTDKAFSEKYGLEEYHYQNQTDRPDSISAASWGKRKHDWDIALPTGIPSKDGICVELIDGEVFARDFFFKKITKNIFKLYPSRTERVDVLGREKAFDAYYEMNAKKEDPNDYHEALRLNREYKKKLEENDVEAQEIFDAAWKRINGCLPEITEEDLTEKKILDWFPNYKKTLNLD